MNWCLVRCPDTKWSNLLGKLAWGALVYHLWSREFQNSWRNNEKWGVQATKWDVRTRIEALYSFKNSVLNRACVGPGSFNFKFSIVTKKAWVRFIGLPWVSFVCLFHSCLLVLNFHCRCSLYWFLFGSVCNLLF